MASSPPAMKIIQTERMFNIETPHIEFHVHWLLAAGGENYPTVATTRQLSNRRNHQGQQQEEIIAKNA